jgi:hypothetical protein
MRKAASTTYLGRVDEEDEIERRAACDSSIRDA